MDEDLRRLYLSIEQLDVQVVAILGDATLSECDPGG
jgi:hypothetical protein